MIDKLNVSPPSLMVDLPYTLTNLKQNKQMKLKNKRVVENPKSEQAVMNWS